MVEEISVDELKALWGTTEGRGCSFYLSREEIEEWKQEGKFKFLKNELMNIPNIKFACTVDRDNRGCWYWFFAHTPEMADKILELRKYLTFNEFVHIYNIKIDYPYGGFGGGVTGTAYQCSLF